MNVLLIGSGGREHALAWSLAKSIRLRKLFVAPGNAGTAQLATNVALDTAVHAAVIDFCRTMAIEFVVVGPEAPLVAGIVDALAAAGIAAFGPTGAAARLEGSKGFTKDFCREFAIPTAAYARFEDAAAAKAHVGRKGAPIVVKADGLAAGKGVVVAASVGEAQAAIDALMGEAGIVVEECLTGEEASFFALCDGERALALGSAQDHKRVGEGDTGPNTGGMGAYSPTAAMTADLCERVMAEIIMPTLAGMRQRGTPFRGVLFAGLMLTAEGPKLIEFNVRFGDPECQVLMLRLCDDLLELLLACARGQLPPGPILLDPRAAVTVVMAAKNYPGKPETGSVIRGIEAAERCEGVTVFHAGTKRRGEDLVADGGRVLGVTAIGANVGEARNRAYAAVDLIDWPEGFCRRDIGWRATRRDMP
jgi:phosphoribosylamine--glycine ligase